MKQRELTVILCGLWALTLLYGEMIAFWVPSLGACSWPHHHYLSSINNSTADKAENPGSYVKIAVIADPQLMDRTSISLPPKSFSLEMVQFYTDLYMRRAFLASILPFKPDIILHLGNLFDGGYILSDDEWQESLSRFKHIFSLDSRGRHRDVNVYFLSGNHDTGYETTHIRSPQVVQRYEKEFGKRNYQFTAGKVEFVAIDAQTIDARHLKEPDFSPLEFVKNLSSDPPPYPTVLLTHIPLYRKDETYCGPNRKSSIINQYNDNSGNPYSDVFWLSALIQSVGELEFGQQSILFLSSLLKHIDRLLQFDRLMPSHNGILTVNCIRSLTQIALKLSGFVPLDRIVELVKPFRDHKAMWQVRIEASRALLDLKFHGSGTDAALALFIQYVEEEKSLRGQVKLVMHAMRLCQTRVVSDSNDEITSQTLVALLRLLEGRISFSNIFLRHHLFCILQILGGRPPTLYGIPRDSRPFHLGVTEPWQEPKNMFGSFVSEIKPPSDSQNLPHNNSFTVLEASKAIFAAPEAPENGPSVPEASMNGSTLPEELNRVVPEEAFVNPLPVPETSLDGFGLKQTSRDGLALAASESSGDALAARDLSKDHQNAPEISKDGLAVSEPSKDVFPIPEPSKEADTVSTSHGRKRPVVKIRMKRSAATSRADDQTADRSQGAAASSSISVDAPPRSDFAEAVVSLSNNHNAEEVNSCHDLGSRMTASIGSAKLAGDESRRELQCTADSGKVTATTHPLPDDLLPSSFVQDKNSVDAGALKFASLHDLSATRHELKDEKKSSRKDKEKKRKREDPDYLERKRLKKEKKKKEKEKEKSKLVNEAKASSVTNEKEETENKVTSAEIKQVESDGSKTISGVESKPVAAKEVAPAIPKFRIKIKNRTLNKS